MVCLWSHAMVNQALLFHVNIEGAGVEATYFLLCGAAMYTGKFSKLIDALLSLTEWNQSMWSHV